jgi:uncharacterized membrane protein
VQQFNCARFSWFCNVNFSKFLLEIHMDKRLVISAAVAALLSVGALQNIAQAQAPEKEKCFGVAKAGQNDCANLAGTHSCAGQSKVDNDAGEWKYAAKGTCKGMNGMSKEEAQAKIAKMKDAAAKK